jgi:hypothetical protein
LDKQELSVDSKASFSGKTPQCENIFNVLMLQQFFEFFKEASKKASLYQCNLQG